MSSYSQELLFNLNLPHLSNATSSSSAIPSTSSHQQHFNPAIKRQQSSEYDHGDYQDDHEDSDHGGAGGKSGGDKKPTRKRNRQALSCTACKHRKIKCSRTYPCIACCKRGDEKDCHWEATTVAVAPQPFALAIDHESLKSRVAHLERLLVLSVNSKRIPGAEEGSSNATPALTTDGNTPDNELSRLETLDSDTEDAALVLEELALGRKMARVGPRARKIAFTSQTPTFLPYSPQPQPATMPPILPHSRNLASLLISPITGRRKLILDDVWKTIILPTQKNNKLMWDWLIKHYYERTDFGWHVNHRPTFLNEYQAFVELLEQGRRDEIDPLWLGTLCMTICISINGLEEAIETPTFSISENDLETLPWLFFEAAEACLESGDWTGKPRIRTLQTIAMFAPFLLFAGVPANGERFQTYLGAATRIAQQIGLNKLGTNPLTMPLDDPALPPGVSTLRREIAIRLLHTLLFLDYMTLRVQSSLRPEYIDTSLPGNYDDSDLVAERGIVDPKDARVVTEISFEIIKYKIALQQRRFNEMVHSRSGVEYHDILDLDAGYRSIIEDLPLELKHDYVPPDGEAQIDTWRRSMICQTIYNRLLRLHRPFMSVGYREPRYRYSTDTAIEAARRCLTAQQSLDGAPLLKLGFQLLNIQGSVVVLFMHLWSEFSSTEEGADSAKEKDEDLIKGAVVCFERFKNWRTSVTRKIAQQSLQTIDLLYDAFEKRRKTVEIMKHTSGGTWVEEEVESYGHLLKRIGEIVVASAKAKALACANDKQHQETTSGLFLNADATVAPTSTTVFSGVTSTNSAEVPSIDPFLMPSDWTGAGGLFATGATTLSFLDSSFTKQSVEGPRNNGDTAFASTDFTTDFDLNSLLGPEYCLPNFDWLR